MDLRDGLRFGECRDEFNRAFLREYLVRIVDRGDEIIEEFGVFIKVKQTEFEDIAVGDDAECAHDDEKGDRRTHIGDIHDELFIGEEAGGRDDTNRQCALGFGRILADGANIGGVCVNIVLVVFADIKHIIGEFLLRDNRLFLAVDDEISAVVVFTLAHIKTGFRFQAM